MTFTLLKLDILGNGEKYRSIHENGGTKLHSWQVRLCSIIIIGNPKLEPGLREPALDENLIIRTYIGTF